MILWLTLTLLCLFIQASLTMMEMAAISFNRLRLHYLISQKVRQAVWLQKLLHPPYRLFGTVMLGVNCALQVGSQSARECYQALHLDPNLAPLSQIFLVMIFGELVPLFAARRCSEHVIMLYTPFLYFIYLLFSPLIWAISLIVKGLYVITKQPIPTISLSKEHLKTLLETSGDPALTTAMSLLAKSELSAAIVMGNQGHRLGASQLDSLFEHLLSKKERAINKMAPMIERSVAGNMRITDFNREYGTHLPAGQAQTLAQLMLNHLEGPAREGDYIAIGEVTLEAEEAGLTGIKMIRVKSVTT